MPVRMRLEGQFQYKTSAEGTAARNWVTNWVRDNRSAIANGSHTLTDLTGSPEGCVSQLQVSYTLLMNTQDEFDVQQRAMEAAIYAGGVATADCESYFGGFG